MVTDKRRHPTVVVLATPAEVVAQMDEASVTPTGRCRAETIPQWIVDAIGDIPEIPSSPDDSDRTLRGIMVDAGHGSEPLLICRASDVTMWSLDVIDAAVMEDF